MIITVVLATAAALPFALLIALSAAFLLNRRREHRLWRDASYPRIAGLGAVDSLTVLPIIDWHVARADLSGEAGVAWLVRAGTETILMDVGLNRRGEHPSPLLRNLANLDIALRDIPTIFISHLHVDHVGGLAGQRKRTFLPSRESVDLCGTTAFVPVPMSHDTASCTLVDAPRVLFPGIASEGPIARAIFAMGLTQEQALVVNVAGKGLVLIVGCGHQRIERIVARAEQLFDEPLYGLIAGLHFPVTASRLRSLGMPLQKFVGTGKFPWQRITRDEVHAAIAFLKTKRLRLVSLSAHDSCDWACGEFRDAFGNAYAELRVGQPITV